MSDALRTVGRYDLLDVIGRGGAAIVYLAHQRDLERPVALKELAPVRAGDETFAARFIAESRLTSSMNHPNVVTVHEFFEHDGLPYIAMEYLPRGSLRQYIGTLTTAQIAGVLEGVLAGLSHGERHGIVHRDLKPENLLVAEDGRVKIADFGVARAYNRAAPREAITETGATIGTPAYMAPEQALGNELTPAADLYSLGVIAWEMLSGQVPFAETDTPMAVLYRQVHEPMPPLGSKVDPRLSAWVERMLAKSPAERFQSADAAWDALEDVVLELLGPRWRREARLVGTETDRVERPLTPATFEGSERPVAGRGRAVAPRRRGLRGPWLVVAALVVIATVGVAVGLAFAGGGKSQSPARSQLAAILRTLDRSRAQGIAQLQHAYTARSQAAAATEIATAYAAAARQVERVPHSQTTTSLRQEVTNTASAYTTLARFARSGNRSAYDAAARMVATDEARLRDTAGHL